MNQLPRVSIVIPMYNSARFLAFTLDSVLGQTMQDIEVVLVDDGSSDDTLRIANDYAARDSRIRVVHGNHGGPSAARNKGFAETNQGVEYVTYLDSDDVWEKDALETLLAALESRPEAPAAHGICRCIDGDGVQFPHDDHAERMRDRVAVVGDRIVPIPRSAATSFGALLVKNYVTTPGTCLVRRSAVDAVGGFQIAGPCEDWDMNLRLARLGDFVFVDKILLSWRRHDGATSNVSKKWRAAYMLTRRRTIDASDNTSAQRNAALVALRSEVLQLQGEGVQMLRGGAAGAALKKVVRSLLLGMVYVRGAARARG